MQIRKTIIISGVIGLLWIAWPGGAIATDAKQHFETGLAHFQQGKFKEAAKMFRKANEQRPNWRIMYNLGQSETASKQYGLAISSFEKYLSRGGDEISDARRSYVIKELQQLREMVGYLEIDAPDGIEIYIDGVHRGATPFSMNLPVAASVEHELLAFLEGNQVNSKIVMVMGQQTTKVSVEIENVQLVSSSGIDWGKDANGGKNEAAPKKARVKNPVAVKKTAIVLAFVGAVTVATGMATGVVALRKKREVDDRCPNGCYADQYKLVDERDHFALTTDILVGVGGGLVVTSAVLLGVSKKMKKEVSMQPTILPKGVATTLQVRF